jgi:hypothetical protein
MNIETVLRETTHAHASETGPPLRRLHDLASVARGQARRRRNRRLLAGATTAVAAVLGAVVAVPHLVEPLRPLELAPASYPLAEFPYTPGWLPDGIAEPHVRVDPILGQSGREVVVEHEAADGERARTLVQVRVLSSAGPGGNQPDDLPGEDIVVRGAAGVLTNDGRWLSVTWTDPAGRVLQAGAAEPAVGRDGLLRYIEEMVEEPLAVTPPVSLATAPVGAELDIVQPHTMTMDLPHGRQVVFTVHEPETVDGLRADLRSSPDHVLPPAIPVEVAGRPAELVDTGEGTLALSISFAPDLMLTISDWRHGEESLLAFAEGAALTQHARPAPIR